MASAGIVDWELGGRIARAVAGDDAGAAAGPDPDAVRAAGEVALARVLAYSGLRPVTEVPATETVTRAEWIAANLGELSELAAPLEARAAADISLPGPLDGLVRGGLGAAGGVEAGVVVGYASRRVLGQYQVSLTPTAKPPRMLLVGRNLASAARELGVDRERFLLWVAIHEQTHSVQFAAVPWLREHVSGLVGRLIDTASGAVDLAALAALARRLVTTDPRRAVRDAVRGELARALAGPAQASILDELQATMAVIEGYAEHVMDAAAAADDGLQGLRARLEERRARRNGLGDLIARALGLGMKLRQYELGKAWSDAVAGEAGVTGLNRVWEEPERLPSLAELERPADWLARVAPTHVP
jgi:coenzyme F420 biosynthesis associated uncharacterized protein